VSSNELIHREAISKIAQLVSAFVEVCRKVAEIVILEGKVLLSPSEATALLTLTMKSCKTPLEVLGGSICHPPNHVLCRTPLVVH
jgi:hypothetical protein